MPVRPFSQSVRAFCASAIGLPMTTNIRKPTTAEEISGITTTGMMPRSTGRDVHPLDAEDDTTGDQTGDQTAEEAGVDRRAIAPPTKPGTRPGRSAMP